MSEENRNKRISVEESNIRVRKWLNANTSYFGRPDNDAESGTSQTKRVDIKDGRLPQTGSMKVLDVKTEIIDQSDASTHNVPVTVGGPGYPAPRHGLVASLPHGATFVPSFMHAGSRNNPGQLRQEFSGSAVTSSAMTQNATKHSGESKGSSFHIDNLFATSAANLPFTKSIAGNITSVSKDYLSTVNQVPSPTVTSLLSKDQQMSFNLSKNDRRKEAKLINPTLASGHQKESHKSTMPTMGIPPLRVSPSVSQFASMGMLHAAKQGTFLTAKSRKTPTRESPSSHGSSMSPQASSVRTNISRTDQQSPSASPQSLSKSIETHQKLIKQGPSVPPYSMDISRPPLSMSMPLSTLLHPSDAPQRHHIQHQHLAEAFRSRYAENQRMAALNSFRAPHMNAASSPFRQGKCFSNVLHGHGVWILVAIMIKCL